MTGFDLLLTCLALNVYKEARGEPDIGQMAVALVTINRARNRFDGDVCKAVFQDKQFSWTITDVENGVLLPSKRPNRKSESWLKATEIARMALTMKDFTGGANHYHATYVSPAWVKNLELVGKWGDHIFYKEKRK